MKRTVYNHVRAKATLAIVARTATANGTAVDRKLSGASGTNEWHQSATLLVHTGAITDGTHAITLEVSDDNSSWAAADASDLQGSLPSIGSSDDDKVYEVGYTGTKRYLRAVTTVSGTTTGGVYGATILLGFPNVVPLSRT
ncbi:hypothetical protein [Streptomyces soliscabiei]|uniref:hypothetical protein n=1 Tax=Streptomyces soliscabiei TaxID=588897 RepID=UPI0029B75459|nr:hypothetical protein [Streptomyces sp. NY05-11A]MDX2681102.1 hypothetical protein [Streptomyces sp. NY05-11A]